MAGPNFWNSVGSGLNGMADRLLQVDHIQRAAKARQQMEEREKAREAATLKEKTDRDNNWQSFQDALQNSQSAATDPDLISEGDSMPWEGEVSPKTTYELAMQHGADSDPRFQNYYKSLIDGEKINNKQEYDQGRLENASRGLDIKETHDNKTLDHKGEVLKETISNNKAKQKNEAEKRKIDWAKLGLDKEKEQRLRQAIEGKSTSSPVPIIENDTQLEWAKEQKALYEKERDKHYSKYNNSSTGTEGYKTNNFKVLQYQSEIEKYEKKQLAQPASPPAPQSNPLGITRK